MSRAFAATYYVSPSGNDALTAQQARNPATPWKTLKKAAGIITAGDSLIVKSGVYNESLVTFANTGNAQNWIVVTAEAGASPEITGSGNCGFLLQGDKTRLFSKSHFLFSGLTFRGYLQDGITVYYADHVVFDRIHAHDNGNAGINTMGTNHILMQDCVLHHNGWKPDGDSGWGDGASFNNRELLTTMQKWTSVVRRCVMYANWQKRTGSYWDGNGFTWDLAGTGGNHLMSRNVFYNNGGSGVLNNNTGNMALVHNVLFRNMADYNRCQNMAELYLTDQWVENTVLKNNVVYARARTAKYDICPIILENAANNTGLTLQNNLVWSEAAEAAEMYWGSFQSIATWKNRHAPSTLTAAPGFVSAPLDNGFTAYHGSEWISMNAAQYNFELKKESPCVDRGAFLTATRSAGSGNDIPVESARCFTDGFGLPGQGDLIQVGGQTGLLVTAVDYDQNVLRVDRAVSWSAGDPVGYPYSGSNPDIGVHEYAPVYYPHGETDPPAESPTLYADLKSEPVSRIRNTGLKVTLEASDTLTQSPGTLFFDESDSTVSEVALTGAAPGRVFSGTLFINPSLSEGTGTFRLAPESLRGACGGRGDRIRTGAAVTINKTAPTAPRALQIAAIRSQSGG